jgi:hypothetical protein
MKYAFQVVVCRRVSAGCRLVVPEHGQRFGLLNYTKPDGVVALDGCEERNSICSVSLKLVICRATCFSF